MPIGLSQDKREAVVHERADARALPPAGNGRPSPLSIVLLTGGQDPHYALGLATALMDQNVTLDVIGGVDLDLPPFHSSPRSRFLNLHGAHSGESRLKKIGRIFAFYARLFRYTLTAKPKIFHILWNNRLQSADRTLVMLLYRVMGKRVVLTAHNVNAGKRDGTDSWLNRLTLKWQYALTSHIFVHTQKMKDELVGDFRVEASKITIIPYGINNAVPFTDLSTEEARRQLGVGPSEKVLLYFGAIKPYKGLEYLVAAFQQVAAKNNYRLIIAGERKKGCEDYWDKIQQNIETDPSKFQVLQRIAFIPDAETEIFFKAADVAVLPYIDIFQSGILFMAYTYGLPVIGTDVGSFSQDIDEGRTGYLCRPRDSQDLAAKLERYFASEMYRNLERRRPEIRNQVLLEHSWTTVAEMTKDVYRNLLDPVSTSN